VLLERTGPSTALLNQDVACKVEMNTSRCVYRKCAMALFAMSHRDTGGIVARKTFCSSFDGSLSGRVSDNLSWQIVGLRKNSLLGYPKWMLPFCDRQRGSSYDQNVVVGGRKKTRRRVSRLPGHTQ
jgi:hypothetical protein